MNSCSARCWCCKGWGAPGSKALLAAAAVVVLGSAARTAIGEVVVPGIGKGEVKDSVLEQGSGLAAADEESWGAVGGGVAGLGQV